MPQCTREKYRPVLRANPEGPLPYHPEMPAAPVSLPTLVDDLRADARLAATVVYSAYLPAADPRFGTLDPPLPGPLQAALAAGGARQLWSHQIEGLEALRRGEHVLVTTPTASGKSLIFHLPVLEEVIRGGPGKALFLFPLKALGQDQRAKLAALAKAAGLDAGEASCEVYDGDTTQEKRREIKLEFPRVVISNPDMLHAGLLGRLESWLPFFGDLRWIVLDELHTYRGIFGSHFHHVLARLLRACRLQGAKPQIIASSATAANAQEFAELLSGQRFHWIHDSGAPREGRHFVLLRPEQSPYTTALRLFVNLLSSGMKTIVFTKARRITELLFSWLRRQEPELARKVASYRSGFLPEERRKIEQRLFSGELLGVISTSALEMGIDVGGLDACVLVGYPGSMMATWQRSGRVGRGGQESLTALVAMPDALDQYLLDHPQEFLDRPYERLVVDPGNELVARAHLVCAAAELPLQPERDREYLEPFAPLVGELLKSGELVRNESRGEIQASRRAPHRDVSLRGTGRTSAILEVGTGKAIGTVDGVRVLHECHPGAVYLHGGRQFLVRELDLEAKKAWVERMEMDYFTTPLTEKETEIREVMASVTHGPMPTHLGKLKVTERVVGFEEKRLGSQELLARHPLELPESQYETVGLWFEVPRVIEEAVRLAGDHYLGALHAAEHAGISLYPLLALCDRGDIGGISYPLHPQTGNGTVFIYDGHPGGVGIAARVFKELPELLAKVLALVTDCPCDGGCPSCVQSPKCGNGNRPLDKGGAAHLLRLLLGRELPPREALVAAERPRPPLPVSPRKPQIPREVKAEIPPIAPEPPAAEAAPEIEPVAVKPPSGNLKPARKSAAKSRRETPTRAGSTVLFDVETKRSADDVGGWGNAHRMGVAVGVALVLEEGRFEIFEESRVNELVALLKGADLVVGFNIRRFDYTVLSGYTGEDFARLLPTLDLLEVVHQRLGFRLGMGALAQATLGTAKSADGLQSLEWVKQGRLDLVTEYCKKDVEILRDLYLYGRREGHLYYLDKRGDRIQLAVEW